MVQTTSRGTAQVRLDPTPHPQSTPSLFNPVSTRPRLDPIDIAAWMDSRPRQGTSHSNIFIHKGKGDLPVLKKPDPTNKTNTATHANEAWISEKLCGVFNRSTTRFGLKDLQLYSIRRTAIVELVASRVPMPLKASCTTTWVPRQ